MSSENLNPEVVEFFVKNRKKKPEMLDVWLRCGVANGRGIWCFICSDATKNKISCEGKTDCIDPDRLELHTLVEFLEWVYDETSIKNITIYCKSSYVVSCIREWIDKWKRSDFLISEGNYRPNSDLLRKIDTYRSKINISIGSYIENNDTEIESLYVKTVESSV
jgi:ribonuclease HI